MFILIGVHPNPQGEALEEITSYLVKGFKFGFEVFGPVISVAAFFYLEMKASTCYR